MAVAALALFRGEARKRILLVPVSVLFLGGGWFAVNGMFATRGPQAHPCSKVLFG